MKDGEEVSYYVRVGMGIQRARKAAGLSKAELSRRIGLKAVCNVTGYEDVRFRIPAYRLHKIAQVLGVSVRQIENANNPVDEDIKK